MNPKLVKQSVLIKSLWKQIHATFNFHLRSQHKVHTPTIMEYHPYKVRSTKYQPIQDISLNGTQQKDQLQPPSSSSAVSPKDPPVDPKCLATKPCGSEEQQETISTAEPNSTLSSDEGSATSSKTHTSGSDVASDESVNYEETIPRVAFVDEATATDDESECPSEKNNGPGDNIFFPTSFPPQFSPMLPSKEHEKEEKTFGKPSIAKFVELVEEEEEEHSLTQALVIRDGTKFTMYLQDGVAQQPVYYRAEKKMGKVILYSLDAEGRRDELIIGTLVKKSVGKTSLVFSLFDADCVPAASIHYEIPSLKRVLLDAPPRKATVTLLDAQSRNIKLETKTPEKDEKTGKKHLNTNGRGRKASRKNMQLEIVEDKMAKKIDQDDVKPLALQLAKWDGHHYHLDFMEPVTAFQAFGFALAQFNL